MKKLEIHRKGRAAWFCSDNIRADISVAFLHRCRGDRGKCAEGLSDARCGTHCPTWSNCASCLRRVLEALKTAGKTKVEFHELFTEERIKKFREQDPGDHRQRPRLASSCRTWRLIILSKPRSISTIPNNVLDSEGIKKITEITQRERVSSRTNSPNAPKLQVEKENADADIAKRERKRRNEEDTAKQTDAGRHRDEG